MTKNGHTQEPSVTIGADWRRPREVGYLVKLPSGHIARIRPVGPEVFTRLSRIPVMLGEVMTNPDADMEIDFSSPDKLKDWLEVINAITAGCMVNPRIVETPTADDEITIDDVDISDRAFLFALFGKPVRALEIFCRESFATVAGIHATEDDRAESIGTAEHQPVGE